jgi:hypothetical protein
MEKQIQEITIPFKWQGWDQCDILLNFYFTVEFTEDFGVFKKGETFESISVDYSKGLIEAYGEKGESVIKTQQMKFFPI